MYSIAIYSIQVHTLIVCSISLRLFWTLLLLLWLLLQLLLWLLLRFLSLSLLLYHDCEYACNCCYSPVVGLFDQHYHIKSILMLQHFGLILRLNIEITSSRFKSCTGLLIPASAMNLWPTIFFVLHVYTLIGYKLDYVLTNFFAKCPVYFCCFSHKSMCMFPVIVF